MPRAINVQALDARFGHVLSVVALAGGVVAQPQLDEWLGCEKRRRRLCRRLTDYRLGAVVPVHGTPIRFWRLTHASMRELLCRPSARVASGEPARMASVAGVEYRLREGRMLLTLKTGAPTLIREVVEAAQKQIRDDAAALKKRIKKLQSEAEAAGEQPSSELRRLVAQHEALRSRWPEPEETTARFLETANVRSVFVDPTASDGETLVFATLAANPKRYRDLFGALSRAVLPLERSARLRVLCGSPYEASVVEQELRHVEATNAEQPMGDRFIADAIGWEAVDLGIQRFFHGRGRIDELLVPSEAERANLLASLVRGEGAGG